MLIHVKDANTLQGARTLHHPFIIPYGIHQEYELQIVSGIGNQPVDIESRGCVKWTLTVTPSAETPTKVLAYAVFPENIATGSVIRFDLAATSVEMYKQVAGNPATPAVLQLLGFTSDDEPASVKIVFPVALTTTAQTRLPVDLSTALMQEIQLATAVTGAAERVTASNAIKAQSAAEAADQAASDAAQHAADLVDEIVGSKVQSAVSAASAAEQYASDVSSYASDAVDAASTALAQAAIVDDRASQAFQHEVGASSAMSRAVEAEQTVSGYTADVSSAMEHTDSAMSLASEYKDSAHDDMARASQAEQHASLSEQHASSSEELASQYKDSANSDKNLANSYMSSASHAEAQASQAETHASQSEQLASQHQNSVAAMSRNVSTMSSNVGVMSDNASVMSVNMEVMSSDTLSRAGEVSAMSSAVSVASSNVVKMSSGVSAMSGNVTAMSSNVAALEGSVVTMSQAVSTASVNVATMSSNVATASTNVMAASSNVVTMSGNATGMHSEVSAMSGAVSMMSSNIGIMSKAVSSNTGTVSSMSNAVGLMSSAASQAEIHASSYADEAAADSSDVAAMSGSIVDMSSSVGAMSAGVSATSKGVDLVSASVASMSAGVSNISKGADSVASDISAVQADISNMSEATSSNMDVAVDKANSASAAASTADEDRAVVASNAAQVSAMSSATESNASAAASNRQATVDNVSSAGELLTSTENAASAADESDSAASSSAKLAESWAKGSTGVRDGEDTDNAKYYAGLSSQYSPEGKADKVQGDVDGHLAALDSTGNLKDSEIPVSDVALQDGYYAKEGLGAKTAENLIDPNATPAAASFGFRTAAGDVSISDDSNGQFDSFEGVTHTINQAVKPSDSKTATGEGSIQVTDGYAGSAEGLTLTGDTYVRNQLVQDTVVNDANASSGVIEVSDAIASNAPGFTMYGDAYVRNQQFNLDAVTGGVNYEGLATAGLSKDSNGVFTVDKALYSSGVFFNNNEFELIAGNVYLIRFAYQQPEKENLSNKSLYLTLHKKSTTTKQSVSFSYANFDTSYIAKTRLVISNSGTTLLSIQPSGNANAYSSMGFKVWDIQFVNITQLCNGDATKIDAIQTWDDLVARYPEYANYVEYNAGEVVGSQPTYKKTDADSYAYGIIMDTTVDTVPCQRVEYHNGVIEQVQAFSSMPAHDWHRCVMDDLSTCHVNYYLDPTDSTKKYNGTFNSVTSDGSSSVLTGADGDVMVEMQPTWWRLTENYAGQGKHLYLVSDKYFQGAVPHRFFYTSPNGDTLSTQYVGAYRAILCDADGIALNTTEGALSQNNGTASTRKARSVAGALPWTNVTLADLRAAAVRNGGTLVNFDFHMYVYLMMIIEYATVDTQAISAGYSNGKNYVYWCFRKSGRTNYGNGTGQTLAVAGTNDDDNFYSLKVNNVQLYRDADSDANGYYGWSTHTASPTRYWTSTATPSNGSTAYSDTNGTASSYTTTAWSTTSDAGKVIQFQYRGIENPFGEVWEFEDGFQKYAYIAILSVKNPSNVVFNRDSSQDATGAYAWKSEDGTITIWTAVEKSVSGTQAAFSDSAKTTSAGFTVAPDTWRTLKSGYWQTNATSDYTSTDQQAASTKTYWWFDHEWPTVANYIRSIDPKSLLPTATGDGASGSKWFRDRLYNDTATGSCASYLGGGSYSGSYGGLLYRYLINGLGIAFVNIGCRASANKALAE